MRPLYCIASGKTFRVPGSFVWWRLKRRDGRVGCHLECWPCMAKGRGKPVLFHEDTEVITEDF